MGRRSTDRERDMTSTITPALHAEDLDRLLSVVRLIGRLDTGSVLASAVPRLRDDERAALVRHTAFAHAAVLVFPETLDGLAAQLSRHGLEVGAPGPSVVVRDRLSRRYSVPAARLDVAILRAPVANRAGRRCEVEIFALVTPPDLRHVAEDERRHDRESHLALTVAPADPVVAHGSRAALRAHLSPDGGGYNGHEDATVLYFRDPRPSAADRHRLELICAGHHPDLLAAHRRESAPATALLRLLTGAWATRAVATAAELRLPDHLATTPGLPGLAAATGADPDSLARLLRYLTALGVVRPSGSGHELTDLGTLLRSDVEGSMRALALMYGGPFYRSFAGLTEAVRTGEESYAKVFGAHHFAHMAAEPGLAELFHESMAASGAMFTEAARVLDLSAARVVVDVAGGNGELLSRVLTAHPHLHGVLMDRPHALAAAEPTVAPVADRCALVPGDFTESVPTTGDVYLLSRVLHDWDDQRCRAILSTCARDMPDHAELVVLERLLPESQTEDLAVPWDIHMLCNTGGRERTESQYRALLAEAGFDLVETHPLPLDAHLLRARKHRSQ
nr:hypothetical protein GCM10017745_58920 [Saccharothrix mutabilis subsp. capreolus]